MHFINNLHNIPKNFTCVATIGNFDGVHRGHQQVLSQLTQEAAQHKLPSLVIIFEPQPREFFTPEQAPARVTRLREKLILLAEFNIDYVLCLPFNKHLAAMPAEDFFHAILVKKLGVRYLTVGEDFRFGQARKGDFTLLKNLGALNNMIIAATPTFLLNEIRVSSTVVRQALAAGSLKKAEHLLGRPFFMCGRVIHGDKRGRELGFPTANINIHRLHAPVQGIFIVQMKFPNQMLIDGVASIGTRPMFNGIKTILEVYLLNFSSDIYQEYVQINFLQKLREEMKFASVEELIVQMKADVEEAQRYFSLGFTNIHTPLT